MQLTERETVIALECLSLIDNDSVFPSWELETLIGATPGDVAILKSHVGAHTQLTGEDVSLLIAVAGQVLGYPKGPEFIWDRHFTVSATDVLSMLKKLETLGTRLG